jgi:hypothetical protein
MFKKFQLKTLPLEDILLDIQNPRIVSAKPLKSQHDIIAFLLEHEGLLEFIKKIAKEGKNPAAERPYVFRAGKKYVVGEGNTRIAAYKILTGQQEVPAEWATDIPMISEADRKRLLNVDVSVAPSNGELAPLKARLHFGLGDKSGWSWLSSRQEIFTAWIKLKSISSVSKIFDRKNAEIQNFILEYKLYREALGLAWTDEERAVLQQPRLEFNPPIRFLESKGHKEKLGISLDKTNLKVSFTDNVAKQRFKHLITKLVISKTPGIGATASFGEVFNDFKEPTKKQPAKKDSGGGTATGGDGGSSGSSSGSDDGSKGGKGSSSSGGGSGQFTKKLGRLFDCKPKVSNTLLEQLMLEAGKLDCRTFPGAGTVLLRCIVEALIKRIIQENNLDPKGAARDLNDAIGVIKKSASTPISKDEKKVLGEFAAQDLQYLNLVAHANIRPNFQRLEAALSVIDLFVRKYV